MIEFLKNLFQNKSKPKPILEPDFSFLISEIKKNEESDEIQPGKKFMILLTVYIIFAWIVTLPKTIVLLFSAKITVFTALQYLLNREIIQSSNKPIQK